MMGGTRLGGCILVASWSDRDLPGSFVNDFVQCMILRSCGFGFRAIGIWNRVVLGEIRLQEVVWNIVESW
jgi:hypothetical protein